MFYFMGIEITLMEQRVIYYTFLLLLVILKECSITECLYFQQRVETGHFMTEGLVGVTECSRYDRIIYPNIFDFHLIHSQGACLVSANHSGTTHGLQSLKTFDEYILCGHSLGNQVKRERNCAGESLRDIGYEGQHEAIHERIQYRSTLADSQYEYNQGLD